MREFQKLASSFYVLYVEDDDDFREYTAAYLSKFFQKVVTAVDGEEALIKYLDDPCDILITDISMPKMNGIELAREIRKKNPDQAILVTSGHTDVEYFIDMIKYNISGYLIKPIDFEQMNETLYQVLHKLYTIKENERYKTHLEELVEEKTQYEHELEQEKIDNYEKTLVSLVELIDERDSYTGGHSQRVADYAKMIAEELDYSAYECDMVYRAGILHDIGKIATPDAVLLKPGKLSKLEFQLIKEHVNVGAEMLIKIPMYRIFYHIIISHHERYDGSGYPSGLKGDDIPPLARVMMVADSFDAMTTNRIYKGRKSVEKAIEELKAFSAIHFHPDVVEAASKALAGIKIKQTSQLPKSAMEQERFAYYYKDQLVDVYNKNYLDVVLAKNLYDNVYLCMNIFLLRGFTAYNEQRSWQRGDELLREFSQFLKETFPYGLVFRIHGDDFVVLHEGHHDTDAMFWERLEGLDMGDITVESEHFHVLNDQMSTMDAMERFLEDNKHPRSSVINLSG